MKNSRSVRSLAVVAAVVAGLSLAACSSDDDDTAETTAAETTQAAALPTAVELNDILNRAVDPAIPSDQKIDTVQGGDQALELFDIMTQSKQDTGATFEVVDPVLPGILPDTANATVNFLLADRDPMPVSGVEFVRENGIWKLSREWACTLIQNVAPDQVPPLCTDANAALPAEETPVEEAPVEETPVEEAPVDPAAPVEEVPVEEVPAA
ncbi:hypothetical protein [Corynebacterium terpenotabidum]|uniref:Low molecular weight antigen MTB12-like C-terminal domain-containing protein n=1 Tax=Corynebacterium terpenotabidum Y-11 TaxID=1200352 RepID=S4XBV0_9CORY|nr:hypothetical protein [Corynebacterium terpenotabidum]AGP30597.1 hypothetical protein A606_04740 [Corynebacterium terpenotabidum Y-11]